jgi:hypothetical protein
MAKRPSKKLSKNEMTRLLARDLSTSLRTAPMMDRTIALKPVAPKTAPTSNGKASKVDVLKIRRDMADEQIRNQLNF